MCSIGMAILTSSSKLLVLSNGRLPGLSLGLVMALPQYMVIFQVLS